MADVPSLGTLDWDDDGTTANDLTNAAAPDPPANTNNKEDDDVDVNVESLLPKRRERDEEAQAPPAAPALHQQGPAEAQENLGNVDWDEDAPVQQHEQQQEQQQQQQEHWWGGEDVTGATQEAAVNDGHEPAAQEHAGPEGGPDFAKPAARPPPKQAFDVPTSGAFWQHDDRLDESEILDMEKARQEAKRKKKEAMSSEGRWQHDKFAVMDEEEPVVDYGPPRRGRGGRGRSRGRGGGYSTDENGSMDGRSMEHSYDGGYGRGRGRGRGRGQGSPLGQRPTMEMPGMKAPGWQLRERREAAASAGDGGFPQEAAANGDFGGQYGRGSGRRSPSGRGGRGGGRSSSGGSFGGGGFGNDSPPPGVAPQAPGSRRYTVMSAARGGGASAGAQGGYGGGGGFGEENDGGWDVAPSAGAGGWDASPSAGAGGLEVAPSAGAGGWDVAPSAGAGGWDVSPSAGAGGWDGGAASAPAAAPASSPSAAPAAAAAAESQKVVAPVAQPSAHTGDVSLGEADWDAEPAAAPTQPSYPAAQGNAGDPPAEVANLTAQLKTMAASGEEGGGAARPAVAAASKEEAPMDLNAWMSQAMQAAMDQGQTEEQAYATVQAYVAQQTQQYAEQQLNQQ